jgi:hypothetical protein
MSPREVVTCNLLRATLSAESCARRYLARVGIHDVPAFRPCATCSVGASVSTMLIDAGWTPRKVAHR